MTLVEAGKTTIGKLRAVSPPSDSLALELKLSRLLASVEWQSPALAPEAIICIRRWRDPLPGALRLDHDRLHPPEAWRRAMETSLDQWVRQAVRPALDAVPADAQAVLFANRAELLACLASDWVGGAGEASARWWWQSLSKGQGLARVVQREWQDAPEYVPAALGLLAERGLATRYVRTMAVADVVAVLTNVLSRFSLAELQAAVKMILDRSSVARGEPLSSAQPASVTGPEHRKPSEPNGRPAEPLVGLPPAPWRRWVPESVEENLRLEQRLLLGVGLMLQRAPTVVRTSSFAHEAAEWVSLQQAESAGAQQGAITSAPGVVQAYTEETEKPEASQSKPARLGEQSIVTSSAPMGAAPPEKVEGEQVASSMPSPVHRMADAIGAPGGAALTEVEGERAASSTSFPTHRTVGATCAARMHAEDAAQNQVPQSEPVPMVAQPEVSLSGPTRLDHQPGILPAELQDQALPVPETEGELAVGLMPFHLHRAAESVLPGTSPLVEAEIETGFGGVFYLINVGLFLNLYGDLASQPGIALPIWDFVALLGERLVDERIHADVVWSLLAQLAGRGEQDQPGQMFDPPAEWRAPAEWLAGFREQRVWVWTADEGRLRIWHPAGFCVLDVPAEADEAQQAMREMQAYSKVPLIEHGKIARRFAARPLERWLDWLTAYVQARLVLALGLESGGLGRALCEHHARVVVTPARLDIHLQLTELPIEIRLAGLDRDPGWVSAAGRYIAFHFD